MKNRLILIATLVAFLAGCATTSSSLTCTPEVRKMSYADNRLFRDILSGIGGVGFADEASFPDAKVRTITKIEVIVPYSYRKPSSFFGVVGTLATMPHDAPKTGVERWTVQHDGQDTCSYIVKFIPDGYGGTTFVVQKDKGTVIP
jgi:hypothetical protein